MSPLLSRRQRSESLQNKPFNSVGPIPAGEPVTRSQLAHAQLIGQSAVVCAVKAQTVEKVPEKAATQRSIYLTCRCVWLKSNNNSSISQLSTSYLLLTASESPGTLTRVFRGMDSLLPLCWMLTDCAGILLGEPHSLCTCCQ